MYYLEIFLFNFLYNTSFSHSHALMILLFLIEFKKLYQKFDKKFEWVRNDPWKEGEAPFIKVKPFSKISWGLEENGEKE